MLFDLGASYKAKLAKSANSGFAILIAQAFDFAILIWLLYIKSKASNTTKTNSAIGNNSNNKNVAIANNKLDL